MIFAMPDDDALSRSEYKKRIREDVHELRKILAELRKKRHVWLILNGTEVGNKAILLIAPLLFRSIELIEAAIEDTKKGRLLSALSAVRTHYEVTGTMAMILKKLRSHSATDEKRREMVEFLKKMTLGVGKDYLKQYPNIDVQNVHALDRIRCVDEVMPYEPDPSVKPTFLAYGDLCEYVHLNFSASHMTLEYHPANGTIDLMDADKVWNLRARTMNWLSISAGRFSLLHSEAMHWLEQHERLPQTIKMPKYTHALQRFIGEAYLAVRLPLNRKGIWKIKKAPDGTSHS